MAPITQFVRAEGGTDLVLFIIFVVVAGIVNLIKKTATPKGPGNSQAAPTRPHASPGTKDLENFLKALSGTPQSEETSPPPVPPRPVPGTADPVTPASLAAAQRHSRQTSFTQKHRHRTGMQTHRQRLDVTEKFKQVVREFVPPLPTAATSAFAAEVPQRVEPPLGAVSGSAHMRSLTDASRLKDAVVLREVLGPPIALRPIALIPGTIS